MGNTIHFQDPSGYIDNVGNNLNSKVYSTRLEHHLVSKILHPEVEVPRIRRRQRAIRKAHMIHHFGGPKRKKFHLIDLS